MEAPTLIGILAVIREEHLLIPTGMTPIYLHLGTPGPVAYVEGWTPQKEYENNTYNLYPLKLARRFIVPLKINGEAENQMWYDSLQGPAMQALKQPDGHFVLRAMSGE